MLRSMAWTTFSKSNVADNAGLPLPLDAVLSLYRMGCSPPHANSHHDCCGDSFEPAAPLHKNHFNTCWGSHNRAAELFWYCEKCSSKTAAKIFGQLGFAVAGRYGRVGRAESWLFRRRQFEDRRNVHLRMAAAVR